jgi:hypothetical protein
MQTCGELRMATAIKRSNQREVSPEREKLVLQSAKIAAENGRARLTQKVLEKTK